MARGWIGALVALVTGIVSAQGASAEIYAATLPQARAAAIGSPATGYANITNAGATTATNCRLQLSASNAAPVALQYQTSDIGNHLTGTVNTAATIAPGATQNFVFGMTPSGAYSGPVGLSFTCDGGLSAPLSPAVNDFYLVAAATSGPDIIPTAVTPSQDAVMRIPTIGGVQVMATATLNIGATAPLTVQPVVIGGYGVPVSVTVVETTSTGAMIGSPAPSLATTFATNVPRYFTVFATADARAGVPFQPDTLRVVLKFTDAGGSLRGQTSAAIVAPGPSSGAQVNNAAIGIWNVTERPSSGGAPVTALIVSPKPSRAITLKIARSGAPGSITYDARYVSSSAASTGGPINGTVTATSQFVRFLNQASSGFDGSRTDTATFTSNVSWTGSYTGANGAGAAISGTTTGSYSSLNFLQATIADLTGSWTKYYGPSGLQGGSFVVAGDGQVSGNDGSCAIIATVRTMPENANILASNGYGYGGCAGAFFSTEDMYFVKVGQTTKPPLSDGLNLPAGDYYMMFSAGSENAFSYLKRN